MFTKNRTKNYAFLDKWLAILCTHIFFKLSLKINQKNIVARSILDIFLQIFASDLLLYLTTSYL